MVGFVLGLHDGDSYIHGVGEVDGLLRMVSEVQNDMDVINEGWYLDASAAVT